MAFRNSVPRHKEVHWLHHRFHTGEHKSVQCHQRTNSEQQQMRFVFKGIISATKNTVVVKCTSLWRGIEFLKAILKAELCFHRYVHFGCLPIYIFGLHHKQCANDQKDFTFRKFTPPHILQISISKLKCVLMTPYRSASDFTVEKEFKAIRNVL